MPLILPWNPGEHRYGVYT